MNFHQPIIRCASCGLKSYEVTGSGYSRDIGELVETWRENYAIEEGVWESVADALQEIYDGVEERYENIPEGLKEGSSGELLQERMDELDGAISELDFDFEGILSEAAEELDEEERMAIGDELSEGTVAGTEREEYHRFLPAEGRSSVGCGRVYA